MAPLAQTPKIAVLVDSKWRVSERIGSDITFQLPQETSTADLAALVYCLTDFTDHDTVRNEVANLLGRSTYEGLADVLIKVLDNPAEKPRFRAFVTQHLGAQVASNDIAVKKRVFERLRNALSDRDTPVRREALLALVRQRDAEALAFVAQAFVSPVRDANAEMFDLVIRCAQDLDMRVQIPAIQKYTRDGNEAVRIAAIVALSHWRDEKSRPLFEEAQDAPDFRTRRAGKAALERLDATQSSIGRKDF